jgi:hypothetical protein
MQGYQVVEYRLPSQPSNFWRGKVAGIAEGVLLGPFDIIIVFCTEQSKTWFEDFKVLCEDNDLPSPVLRVIPWGNTSEEQWNIVDTVIDAVLVACDEHESPAEITLDITLGYRLLPLLYFTAISFLTSFHDSVLDCVLYAQVDRNTGMGTLVDATPAFEVIEWYHAANMFAKTGAVEELKRLVEKRKEQMRRDNEDFRELEPIRKGLSGLTHYFGAGLPIEIGLKAIGVQRQLERIQDTPASLPLFRHLFEEIRDVVSTSALERLSPKESVLLSRREIERQEGLIERALEHGQIVNALTMLRETLLNKALLEDNPENWLDASIRYEKARRLSAFSKISADHDLVSALTSGQREAGRLWDEVTQTRNRVAHCGYSHDVNDVAELRNTAWNLLERVRHIDLSGLIESEDQENRMLICPLGHSKGAMFSALKHTSPDTLLALMSKDTAPTLDEIIAQSGVTKPDITKIVLEDPYRCFDQFEQIMKEHDNSLVNCSSVMVHVVGGTTFMGELARAFGRRAESLGIPTRVFATIDDREFDEQRENPYVQGDYVEIERWPDSDGE